jgi:predicted dehydrogenase
MMGTKHAEILAASALTELLVCCDIDGTAAGRVPRGAAFTTDLDEALDRPGVEAVFIATPQQHHRAAVEAAAHRRLAVFCEKPIADTLEAADAMIQLARELDLPLVIGHMYRFDPRYRAVAQAVGQGQIGRIVHVGARGLTPDFEGRILAGRTTLANENAIHGIDILRWLAGDVERVYAETSRTGVVGAGLPDSIAVTLRFSSGAVGTLQVDWALPSEAGLMSVDDLLVVGSVGVAWIDARDAGVGILANSRAPAFPGTLSYLGPGDIPGGLYQVEDEHFVRVIREGAAWPIDLPDARSALAVGIAIDRSIAEGRPVRLEELA